ncbi:MAG: 6-bladed beta-propeller, partial [Candidatus Mariimomonas ferrooxydans]
MEGDLQKEKNHKQKQKKIIRKNKMRSIFLTILATVFFLGCAAPEKKRETVFYPMPPDKPRLQFLVSITGEEDIGEKPGAFQDFLLGKHPSMKRIARPAYLAAVKGKIYISDRTYKKILILDLKNKKFDYIRAEKEVAISDPAGIWVTRDEVKYVADMKRMQVMVFGKDNKFLRTYGRKDQFDKPVDVAVYKNRIYVCDQNRNMIIVLDKDTGKTIQTIGETGAEEGKMYKPSHVKVDHEGNIYVNDNFNFRIQMFDPRGSF